MYMNRKKEVERKRERERERESVCVCVFVCVCVCVCVYVYMYGCMYVYVYVCSRSHHLSNPRMVLAPSLLVCAYTIALRYLYSRTRKTCAPALIHTGEGFQDALQKRADEISDFSDEQVSHAFVLPPSYPLTSRHIHILSLSLPLPLFPFSIFFS